MYNGLVIYKITRKAFHWYRFLTKDNDKVSYITARKKLTRNIFLSRKVDEYHKQGKDWSIYHYGDLEIMLSGMTIVNIKRIKRDPDFIFHQRKYEKLTKRLDL